MCFGYLTSPCDPEGPTCEIGLKPVEGSSSDERVDRRICMQLTVTTDLHTVCNFNNQMIFFQFHLECEKKSSLSIGI